MAYFFDSYALIEIAEGNKNYEKYLNSDAVTLKDNLAELFYFLLKKYDEKTALFFFEKFLKIAVELPSFVIPKAMIFRYSHVKRHFSYIDCLGYCYALANKRTFLTGDRAFQGLEKVEVVR